MVKVDDEDYNSMSGLSQHSSTTMRPQSVKELSVDAKNYNYSNNIPLKLWVRTLSLLLANSNSYLKQRYYDESYKLLIRFCEIVLNRLNGHPEVKLFKHSNNAKEQAIYKEYHALYKNLPSVFEEIDKLKIIIDKRYDEYMAKEKELIEQRQLQEEKYLQQMKLYSRDYDPQQQQQHLHKEGDLDDHDTFFQNLRNNSTSSGGQGANNFMQNNDNELQYPSLPASQKTQFRYDFPQQYTTTSTDSAPALPSKIRIPTQIAPSIPGQAIAQQQAHQRIEEQAASAAPPPLPEKTFSIDVGHQGIEHKAVNFTEDGLPLRSIFVSTELKSEFLKISARNTGKKLETCGILAGKLSRNAFFITHLLIPEQISTPNTCETLDEEDLFFTVDKLDLFILGWIHTHPTQSCFLSSVDLHTQNSYQIMLNEAIAIVLSPDPKFSNQDFGCFRLTDPPGLPTISKCNRTGFHPHEEPNLYVTCNRVNNDVKMGHVILKDHLPFQVLDLRKKSKK